MRRAPATTDPATDQTLPIGESFGAQEGVQTPLYVDHDLPRLVAGHDRHAFDELPHDLGIFSVAGGRALRHRLL
jgi:hypothetical protein